LHSLAGDALTASGGQPEPFEVLASLALYDCGNFVGNQLLQESVGFVDKAMHAHACPPVIDLLN
jgi:hypothetical protein